MTQKDGAMFIQLIMKEQTLGQGNKSKYKK
jgi:hypothetical protein